MDNSSGHTINLANSIIGVSLLAMPYCFKQCGVLLSILILLISSVISRLACHFLLKSAIIARRKTFEFLAFHIFGTLGKFCIEIGMIGFLLGTCIAFFVVMGDLAPAIISEVTGVTVGNTLRNSTLVALAVFGVLPLGLLKNVASLNGVSKATIGFYCCLVLKIVIEALPHIIIGDWITEVELWRPAGILQCLPIFSMALFCQTQIFEIYQAIPNASLEKMNSLIRVAVNICTWVYIFVGAFGYIAFFQKPFTGNILLSFRQSVLSDVIKLGFVLSLAFSFPLVIFPCRASLFSLLYKAPTYATLHEGAPSNYIPEGKFKLLTFFIVAISLVIGLMIPNIELVLGLVGSTIGVMICVLFPVTCFICISPKNTNERILAQIMLFVGVIVMVLGSYANLYAFEEANLNVVTEQVLLPEAVNKLNLVPEKLLVLDPPTTPKTVVPEDRKEKPPDVKMVEAPGDKAKIEDSEVRHEPPQPEEPVESAQQKKESVKEISLEVVTVKNIELVKDKQPVETVQHTVKNDPNVLINGVVQHVPEIKNENLKREVKKNDEVDIEAIKKEDTELKEQEQKHEDRNQILIDTIQKQNEVQKEIVEQQKKLIEVIQKQQNKANEAKVNEESVKVVKEIESIVKKAIESIRDEDNNNNSNNKNIANDNNNKGPASILGGAAKKVAAKLNISTLDKNKSVETNEENEKKLLPLPIIVAKANNKSAEYNITQQKNEVVGVKTIHRDILSKDEDLKSRVKRETDKLDTAKVENFNRAIKEVCEEVTKHASTEKPLIKMLCKLSEPALVQASLLVDENQIPVDLKPQKRDLKQFTLD